MEESLLEEAYKMYFKDVYRYMLSICKNKRIAEDITSETFLKALKHLNDFDGTKDMRAWLFTIAQNTYCTKSLARRLTQITDFATFSKFI